MKLTQKRRNCHRLYRTWTWVALAAVLAVVCMTPLDAWAQEKPNILVIMGDDIGWFNISHINRGMMGYKTPNIDRVAQEGMFFTDAYAEQSCTAGRAAFITGQHPFRTGLLRVGLPGADIGLRAEDPTLAELLKPYGYMTGQFGKNHFGDKDEFLPTAHGFDEFFGNLYHLNAEEEPENPDYPKDPEFRKKFGPRGVIKSFADGRIQDTGPLTRKRMETADEEFLAASLDFIDRAHKAKKPFFVWLNTTRMHVWTRLKPESEGVTGQGIYADGMAEFDGLVGQALKKLEDLGIADNTIVVFTTDNGAEVFSWPDGGTIPFRGEKNTNWEGGYRVPLFVKWPGRIPAGKVSNEIISLQDFVPTLMAAAGEPDIKEKLKQGHRAAGKRFKVHLDGYNFLPHMTGQEEKGPRNEFFYFSDDGFPTGIRTGEWKMVFMEQRAHGREVWHDPYFPLRMPKIYNLRRDPFERAEHESGTFDRWMLDRFFLAVPTQQVFARFLLTFKEFPPRQKPADFNLDTVIRKFMPEETQY